MDGIGRGEIWGTDEDEHILNITEEIRSGQGDVARLLEIAKELHQRRKELYMGPILEKMKPSHHYDSIRTSWETNQVLNGFDKLDSG